MQSLIEQPDLLVEIFKNLSYHDIVTLCQLNESSNNAICRDNDFWRRIAKERYGEKMIRTWAIVRFANRNKEVDWRKIFKDIQKHDFVWIYMDVIAELLQKYPLLSATTSETYNELLRLDQTNFMLAVNDEVISERRFHKIINRAKVQKLLKKYHLEKRRDYNFSDGGFTIVYA